MYLMQIKREIWPAIKSQMGRHRRNTPIALPIRICQSSMDVASRIGHDRVSFSEVTLVAERIIVKTEPITVNIIT
jgi:hypothetical protein